MNRDESIPIHTPFIKLDSFLKLAGLVSTGGEAKIRIQGGDVRVDGVVETRRGRKLVPGNRVSLDGVHFTVGPVDAEGETDEA